MLGRRTTHEGSVARWAAVAFGSSLVIPIAALIGLFGAFYKPSPLVALILIIVAAYFAQIILLDRIERFSRLGRRRIWVFSAIFHALLLTGGGVAAALSSWGLLILLVPELVGGILIVVGTRLHAKTERAA